MAKAKTAPTLYEVMEVSESVSPAVLTAVWKAHNKHLHPDVNKSQKAVARIKEINAAYEVLSDPAKRAQYDLSLRASRFSQRHEQRHVGRNGRSGKRHANGVVPVPETDAVIDLFMGLSKQAVMTRGSAEVKTIYEMAAPDVTRWLKRFVGRYEAER